jgi:hypothetical protein
MVEYRRVNVNSIVTFACQAAADCELHFIYLSSIKVKGKLTTIGHPYTAEDGA